MVYSFEKEESHALKNLPRRSNHPCRIHFKSKYYGLIEGEERNSKPVALVLRSPRGTVGCLLLPDLALTRDRIGAAFRSNVLEAGRCVVGMPGEEGGSIPQI